MFVNSISDYLYNDYHLHNIPSALIYRTQWHCFLVLLQQTNLEEEQVSLNSDVKHIWYYVITFRGILNPPLPLSYCFIIHSGH